MATNDEQERATSCSMTAAKIKLMAAFSACTGKQLALATRYTAAVGEAKNTWS